MSRSTAASSPKPANITCRSVVPPEKIIRKASDAAEAPGPIPS